MPRTVCPAPGGLIDHALNRAVARLTLFEKVTVHGVVPEKELRPLFLS